MPNSQGKFTGMFSRGCGRLITIQVVPELVWVVLSAYKNLHFFLASRLYFKELQARGKPVFGTDEDYSSPTGLLNL